jgi:hypothetical protein
MTTESLDRRPRRWPCCWPRSYAIRHRRARLYPPQPLVVVVAVVVVAFVTAMMRKMVLAGAHCDPND